MIHKVYSKVKNCKRVSLTTNFLYEREEINARHDSQCTRKAMYTVQVKVKARQQKASKDRSLSRKSSDAKTSPNHEATN